MEEVWSKLKKVYYEISCMYPPLCSSIAYHLQAHHLGGLLSLLLSLSLPPFPQFVLSVFLLVLPPHRDALPKTWKGIRIRLFTRHGSDVIVSLISLFNCCTMDQKCLSLEVSEQVSE